MKEPHLKHGRADDYAVLQYTLNYVDVLNEICCYIQRTLQLLFLLMDVGVFDQARETTELGKLPRVLKGTPFGSTIAKL